MSIERVKNYLKQFGASDRVMEFEQSSATVELAAAAVGCEPERIAKTLSFDVDERAILIVTAGDVKIDNPKFKAQFGAKAKMLAPEDTVSKVGFAVGGVCPFAVNEGVPIYLDESLKRFKTVFPSGGSDNSAIELTISELEKFTGYKAWVSVTKSAVKSEGTELFDDAVETAAHIGILAVGSNASTDAIEEAVGNTAEIVDGAAESASGIFGAIGISDIFD